MKILIPEIALVILAAGCTAIQVDDHTDHVNRATERDGSPDAAVDLRQCRSSLARLTARRTALEAELSGKGVLRSTAYVVFEVTSSGWGGYNYSYFWLDEKGNGRIVADMVDGDWGKRIESSFPGSELMGWLHETAPPRPRPKDSAGRVVDDGACYFVRTKNEGAVEQFAVYAPNRGDRAIDVAEKFVDRALNIIAKYSRGKDSKSP